MISYIPLWLGIAVSTLLAVRMVVSGLVVRRGILAWPMFTHQRLVDIRGFDQAGVELNQWHYFQHGDVNKTPEEIEDFLYFLETQGRTLKEVEVTAYDAGGVTRTFMSRPAEGWNPQ